MAWFCECYCSRSAICVVLVLVVLEVRPFSHRSVEPTSLICGCGITGAELLNAPWWGKKIAKIPLSLRTVHLVIEADVTLPNFDAF